jgi:hypothetical protein
MLQSQLLKLLQQLDLTLARLALRLQRSSALSQLLFTYHALFVQSLSLFMLSSERIVSMLLLVRTLLRSFEELLIVLPLLLYKSGLKALGVLVLLSMHALHVRLHLNLVLKEPV